MLLPNNQVSRDIGKNCIISIPGESQRYVYIGVPSNLARASRKHLRSVQIDHVYRPDSRRYFRILLDELNIARALHIHFLEFHFVPLFTRQVPVSGVIIRPRSSSNARFAAEKYLYSTVLVHRSTIHLRTDHSAFSFLEGLAGS